LSASRALSAPVTPVTPVTIYQNAPYLPLDAIGNLSY